MVTILSNAEQKQKTIIEQALTGRIKGLKYSVQRECNQDQNSALRLLAHEVDETCF